MKPCARCKLGKPLVKNTAKKTGFGSYCLFCVRAIGREYTAKNREKRRRYFETYREKNLDRVLTVAARRRLTQRARVMISNIRVRALKRGLPFDLNDHIEAIQSRINAGFCEMSKIPFDLSPGRTFASPSIDRIKPDQGYVYSNIRVVCHCMNSALGDWGEEKLRLVITSWLGADHA